MSQAPKNVLSADVEIRGTIIFQNELTTNGRIDGDILSSGALIIGKDGSVEGDIQAAVVSVFGTVNGNITVEQRCELRGNAQLFGDLDAPRLLIEDGATFVGRSKVMPSDSPKPRSEQQAAAIVETPILALPQPAETTTEAS